MVCLAIVAIRALANCVISALLSGTPSQIACTRCALSLKYTSLDVISLLIHILKHCQLFLSGHPTTHSNCPHTCASLSLSLGHDFPLSIYSSVWTSFLPHQRSVSKFSFTQRPTLNYLPSLLELMDRVGVVHPQLVHCFPQTNSWAEEHALLSLPLPFVHSELCLNSSSEGLDNQQL